MYILEHLVQFLFNILQIYLMLTFSLLVGDIALTATFAVAAEVECCERYEQVNLLWVNGFNCVGLIFEYAKRVDRKL